MPARPALFAVVALVALAGCRGKPTPPPGLPAKANTSPVVFPELGPGRVVEPGVTVHEVTVNRGGVPMKVWVYLPDKPAGKLPLVMVPPAGSTLVAGMSLGDGDRAEHTPYVKAGFAVVAFEIDGDVPDSKQSSDAAEMKGAREFRAARAGIDNAQTALDFVTAKVPGIDPTRIAIAGHSSAATLALLVAQYEPRIKACVAYAPCTDVVTRLGRAVRQMERDQPGYAEFLRFSSPQSRPDLVTCPLFLFHAQDDDNVPFSETSRFYDAVKQTNPRATLVKAARGGHYDPMMLEGMPKAIAWLKALPKA